MSVGTWACMAMSLLGVIYSLKKCSTCCCFFCEMKRHAKKLMAKCCRRKKMECVNKRRNIFLPSSLTIWSHVSLISSLESFIRNVEDHCTRWETVFRVKFHIKLSLACFMFVFENSCARLKWFIMVFKLFFYHGDRCQCGVAEAIWMKNYRLLKRFKVLMGTVESLSDFNLTKLI
jgi:hypothetical protein